jgi:PH (Pleckstrin Homology) domain-containing protein
MGSEVSKCSEDGEWRGEPRAERPGVPHAAADRAASPESQREGTASEAQVTRVPPHPISGVVPPVAATAVALVVLGLLAAAGSREPKLPQGELVLFRSRPRKALLRYALTLGLWELDRKTTSFAVTTRRLIVARGLIWRHTRSIPLSAIVDVDLVEGLWEGTVRVSERGANAPGDVVMMGPLRTTVARQLASVIASRAGV